MKRVEYEVVCRWYNGVCWGRVGCFANYKAAKRTYVLFAKENPYPVRLIKRTIVEEEVK